MIKNWPANLNDERLSSNILNNVYVCVGNEETGVTHFSDKRELLEGSLG